MSGRSVDSLRDRLPSLLDRPEDTTTPDDLSRRQFRVLSGLLALLAATLVFVVASEVFSHHSINHDEGVYLQQAELLLHGQLYLRPPVEEAMRPWFFVDAESPAGPARAVPEQAGDVLYSKYSPVTPALYAVGVAIGVPRLVLALVGGGIVALAAAVTAEAFDRRTGVLAGCLFLASPLFVVDAATFLPYAPTTFLNLLFAWAYLRATRVGGDESPQSGQPWALLAGLAIGAAFFARPYTALLFALPFVLHACWSLVVAARAGTLRESASIQALVATGGLVGVVAALGYNWYLTGDPLVFPYLAFAPEDGLGFGRRAILGYERDYTVGLAIEANVKVLSLLFGRWVVAGSLGTLVALVGVLAALVSGWRRVGFATAIRETDARRLILAALFLTIPLGNVAFWGNLNVLGDLARTGDGLVALLGPYYHFDLLLPVALFGAHGLFVGSDWLRRTAHDRFSVRTARRVVAAALLVSAGVFGGTGIVAVADPVAENEAAGDQLAAAYEPVERADLSESVVFLPTPYGDWLNHPFQALRNDPGFGMHDAGSADGSGDTVYAVRERQFEVVDAYPNRSLYRYTYRGHWAPFLGEPVEPHLQPIEHARGERVVVNGTMGVPQGAERVSIRLSADGEAAYYSATPEGGSALPFSLVLTEDGATMAGGVDGNGTVSLDGRTDLRMVAYVDFGAGQAFSYRFTTPVEVTESGSVRALTPYVEVCRDNRLCGGESAYVPGAHTTGISVETRTRAEET